MIIKFLTALSNRSKLEKHKRLIVDMFFNPEKDSDCPMCKHDKPKLGPFGSIGPCQYLYECTAKNSLNRHTWGTNYFELDYKKYYETCVKRST